jgi:hypothetical protein
MGIARIVALLYPNITGARESTHLRSVKKMDHRVKKEYLRCDAIGLRALKTAVERIRRF